MKKKFRPITAATETIYKDEDGAFGDSGKLYTWDEITDIWDELHEVDPVMNGYTSFDDWWSDTSPYFSKYEIKRID